MQFVAPRGAANTHCPQGWRIDTIALRQLTRVSIPVLCGAERGSVVALLEVRAPVWTLRSDLPRGHSLRPEDLTPQSQRIAQISDVLAASDLIGLQLKNDTPAGQALRARDLLRPIAMRKGDKVEIRAQGDGVQVSVMGVATRTAKLGESVSVRNVRTGRLVQGVLIAPGVLQADSQPPAGAVQVRAAESGD